MPRLPTGSDPLDQALGGGLPLGSSILIEGPHGVGSTEFALCILRSAAASGHKAIFASGLRTAERVRAEASQLFDDAPLPDLFGFKEIREGNVEPQCVRLLGALASGDALVIESTAALLRLDMTHDLPGVFMRLSNAAHEAGVIVAFLHAPGTLPLGVESALAELADGILTFGWRDGGQSRRRSLFITKLRGLAPALGGDQIPVFEARLHGGAGFSISRIKSLV